MKKYVFDFANDKVNDLLEIARKFENSAVFDSIDRIHAAQQAYLDGCITTEEAVSVILSA